MKIDLHTRSLHLHQVHPLKLFSKICVNRPSLNWLHPENNRRFVTDLTSCIQLTCRRMGVVVYISSVSSSKSIKGHQQKIQMILSSKKIEFTEVDISAVDGAKEKMQKIAGSTSQLPPVICNDDTFCGDFDAFEEAVENEELMQFLKLA